MQPNNPACYECPKVKSGIHTWTRRDDMTAWCIKCDTELTVEQTADVWHDHDALQHKICNIS